jgi:hypothetical protein
MTVFKALDKRAHLSKGNLQQWLPITLILVMATVLRLYQLDTESLWIDEIFSIRDAEDLTNLQWVRPIYYILLRLWMILGSSTSWLRGLSVVFGVISVFLIYRLARHTTNEITALLASCIFACSPLAIWHSQEVRMYMLSACLGIGGSLALSYNLQKTSVQTTVAWITLRLLAVLSTPINLILFLPDAFLLIYQYGLKSLFLKYKSLLLLACFLSIPTLYGLSKTLPKFMSERSSPLSIGDFKTALGVIAQLIIWPHNSVLESSGVIFNTLFDAFAITSLVLISVTVFISFFERFKSNPKIIYILAWGFIPFLALLLFSLIFGYGYFKILRYVFFISPYIIILFANGLTTIYSSKRQLIALVLASIYMMTLSCTLFLYYKEPLREDWRGVAAFITAQEKTNDAIVIFPNLYSPGVSYYYDGNAKIYNMAPESVNWSDIDSEAEIRDIFSMLPSSHSRLWLIFRFNKGAFQEQYQNFQSIISTDLCVNQKSEFPGQIEMFQISIQCED